MAPVEVLIDEYNKQLQVEKNLSEEMEASRYKRHQLSMMLGRYGYELSQTRGRSFLRVPQAVRDSA